MTKALGVWPPVTCPVLEFVKKSVTEDKGQTSVWHLERDRPRAGSVCRAPPPCQGTRDGGFDAVPSFRDRQASPRFTGEKAKGSSFSPRSHRQSDRGSFHTKGQLILQLLPTAHRLPPRSISLCIDPRCISRHLPLPWAPPRASVSPLVTKAAAPRQGGRGRPLPGSGIPKPRLWMQSETFRQ